MKIIVWCKEKSKAINPCCLDYENPQCGKLCDAQRNYLRDHSK
jgi:hypothetical protein